MSTAVVIVLSDEGQVSVGEIDAETVDTAALEPVETIEEAFSTSETLLLGDDAPPEIEEDSFTAAANTPDVDPDLEG